MDSRVDKTAEVIVNYSAGVRPGDLVMIHMYSPLAEPLALAIQKHVLLAGANPVFRVDPTDAQVNFLKYAGDAQLDYTDPVFMWLMENIDVRIALQAPVNTKALTNADPERIARHSRARAPLMKTFMRRDGDGSLRWAVTQYPTAASAQDAEMSLAEYEDFVYGASMVHLDDPIAYWKGISAEQQRLVDWLEGKQQIEVKGENIDLSLSIKDRVFVNADGTKNFPDGEIFTGPVEDSVNGWVKFTFPAIYNDREVDGVELTFEDGKIVKATAEKGEDYLNSVLDTDPGARYLGEFAIGTNKGITQFTRNILFDEKIGGTVHMACGAGYPETGSHNESAIHWDMICDMRSGGEITVDGELFYKDGEFQI